MSKMIHPDNRLYYSEEDNNLSSAVSSIKELILIFGKGNQGAIFKDLKKSTDDRFENFRHLEYFLKLVMTVRGSDIAKIISGKTKMSSEMVAHMALSEIDI